MSDPGIMARLSVRIARPIAAAIIGACVSHVSGDASPTGSAQGAVSQKPAITATPNPVPAAAGPGTTTITWTTGSDADGEVRVSIDGAPDRTFARGKSGSSPAAWIQTGTMYDFRLYVASATTPAATVRVIRAAPPSGAARISASPNPVPSGAGPGETTVSWTTGNGSEGRVKVAADDGLERLVGQGPSGELRVNWINSSASYEFRLYSAGVPSALLAKVSVSRAAATTPVRTPPAITFTQVESTDGSNRPLSRVNWTTGDRSDGKIYVSKNGGTSDLFGQGPTGSVVADWMHPGSSYEFKLYSVATGALLVTEVVTTRAGVSSNRPGDEDVTPVRMSEIRSRSFIAAAPNPVPAGIGAGATNVSWYLDYLDNGRVTLSIDGGEEREIDAGSGGSVTVPSVRAGSTYELRLYGGNPATQIVSLTVTRRSMRPWILTASGLFLVVVLAGVVVRRRSRSR